MNAERFEEIRSAHQPCLACQRGDLCGLDECRRGLLVLELADEYEKQRINYTRLRDNFLVLVAAAEAAWKLWGDKTGFEILERGLVGSGAWKFGTEVLDPVADHKHFIGEDTE